MNKKFIMISIIGIFLTLTILIGVSYAIWMNTVSQSGVNIVNTDCFEITYRDQDDIALNNAYPVTDEVGETFAPYKFTIKNVCETAASYQINLETMSSSTLNISGIKLRLNENAAVKLEDQTSVTPTLTGANDARNLETGILFANEEKTYNLRLWLNSELTTSDDIVNKTFVSKVNVITTLNKNAKQIHLNTNEGTISSEIFIGNIGSEIGTLPEPKKTGFEFVGWYSDSELTNPVTSSTIVSSDLNDLYAKWQ